MNELRACDGLASQVQGVGSNYAVTRRRGKLRIITRRLFSSIRQSRRNSWSGRFTCAGVRPVAKLPNPDALATALKVVAAAKEVSHPATSIARQS